VTYIRNVTDVDDKIIATATAEGLTTEAVVDRAYAAFAEAHSRLGVKPPTIEPWATHHIGEMVELIGQLIEAGHAYAVGGDVYFSVRSDPESGKLSRHDPDDFRSGSRIEPDERKRDPLDFALWKAARPGEPSWVRMTLQMLLLKSMSRRGRISNTPACFRSLYVRTEWGASAPPRIAPIYSQSSRSPLTRGQYLSSSVSHPKATRRR
jgi:hypothetical protein